MVGHLCRGFKIALLGFFHQGIDHVYLAPLLELVFDKLVCLPTPALEIKPRDNRASAGREFIDHGHIEVTIDGEGERPRDRRCRHHQNVWLVSLGSEGRALHYTEPVLLVDDGKAEAMKLHILFYESMRPDHYLRHAGFYLCEKRFLLFLFDTTCKQPNRNAEGPCHGVNILRVL